MSGAERCDEIVRLIDEALGQQADEAPTPRQRFDIYTGSIERGQWEAAVALHAMLDEA